MAPTYRGNNPKKKQETVGEKLSKNFSDALSRLSDPENWKKTTDNAGFFHAVKANDLKTVSDILKNKKADPNVLNISGFSPLHLAAQAGLPDMIELLVKNGAQLEQKCATLKQTPLEKAVTFSKPEAVKKLIQLGADSKRYNHEGWALIHVVAQRNNPELMAAFLQAGVDGNTPTQNGSSPIQVAVVNNSVQVIDLLLKNKDMADHAKKAQFGDTEKNCLHVAVISGHHRVAESLLKAGFPVDDPDKDGMTPLLLAACNNDPDMVRLLVKNGADINKKDLNGMTPLIILSARGSNNASDGTVDAISLLLDQGADYNVVNPDSRKNLLHYVCQDERKKDLLDLFIEKGVDVNAEDKYGVTPILEAVRGGNVTAVKKLLEKNVDINKPDRQTGRTPLMEAIRSGQEQVATVLIERGANPYCTDQENRSAMYFARMSSRSEVFTQMITDCLKKKETERFARFKKQAP